VFIKVIYSKAGIGPACWHGSYFGQKLRWIYVCLPQAYERKSERKGLLCFKMKYQEMDLVEEMREVKGLREG
jgi:hypothetical protein